MFCKKEDAGKKGHRYFCSKEAVRKRLELVRKAKKKIGAPVAVMLPGFTFVIGLFTAIAVLEAVTAVTVMTVPAAIICSIALRATREGTPASVPLCSLLARSWRLCCYSYTLYAFFWAVASDWFGIVDAWGWRQEGTMGKGHFLQDSFALYAMWTVALCRVAALPVMILVRVEANMVERRGGAAAGERQR